MQKNGLVNLAKVAYHCIPTVHTKYENKTPEDMQPDLLILISQPGIT